MFCTETSENVFEILRSVVKKDVSKTKKLGYYNAFVRLCYRYGNNFKVSYSKVEILCWWVHAALDKQFLVSVSYIIVIKRKNNITELVHKKLFMNISIWALLCILFSILEVCITLIDIVVMQNKSFWLDPNIHSESVEEEICST